MSLAARGRESGSKKRDITHPRGEQLRRVKEEAVKKREEERPAEEKKRMDGCYSPAD